MDESTQTGWITFAYAALGAVVLLAVLGVVAALGWHGTLGAQEVTIAITTIIAAGAAVLAGHVGSANATKTAVRMAAITAPQTRMLTMGEPTFLPVEHGTIGDEPVTQVPPGRRR